MHTSKYYYSHFSSHYALIRHMCMYMYAEENTTLYKCKQIHNKQGIFWDSV